MDTGIVVRNRTKKRIDAPSPDASFTPVTIGYETARTPHEVVYVLTRYLANRCDGASTPDGVGFNKIDTRFGHKLAEIPFEEWSPRQLWAARKMLTRYKNRQLKQWWESVPDIPEPERPQELIKHREEYDRYQRRSNPGYQREPDFRELSLVTVDGQQAIQLRQSYDPRLVDAIKSLPHRKYDKDKKAWYCFLHLENLEKTLDFAIDWGYDIPQDVLDACNAVMADFADSIDMSHAATSDFRVTGINGELFPFQVAGVEYAQKKGNTLIADEMGLGKTLQALAAISMSEQFPAIVICPASLKQNWAREIRKWLPNRTVQVLGSVLHRITQYDGTPISDIVVINYNIRTLEKWYDRLVELNPKAIICDEAHALKNPGASQSKKVADLIEETNARLLFLSGTPVMNRPMEFWQLLKLLGYGQIMGGYNAYKARYDTKNVQKLRELNTRARSTFLIRRRKEDVLTDLPPKLYSVVPLEITNRDEYLKTERDVAAYFATKKSEDERWLADIRREAIRLNYDDRSISVDDIVDAAVKQKYREHYSVAAMNERLLRWEALKQRALEGKMKAALEWITDFLDNSDQKLVLFGVHKTEVRSLAERFSKKYGAVYITGEIPPDERLPIVDKFQNDPNCRLIVGNMKAMGEGLTLTAASNVAFIEFGWNPAQHGQAEDRCHRIGQNDSVTVYSLVARDTIDEEIVALIEEKRAIADAIQDGDTGVTVSMMAALSDRMEKRRLGQVAGTDDDWSDDDEAA